MHKDKMMSHEPAKAFVLTDTHVAMFAYTGHKNKLNVRMEFIS